MEYSKEFFLDEVRDGFLIPSFMKKQWAVCLDDYKKLDEICKSNGLRCTLSWGSLIGAIRHGGFVPWDDDLDVEMPREDFEKLQEIVGKEEVEGEYHIDDFTTVGNTNTARRWIEKSTLLYDADRWADRHGFPFGNAIDIFILDNIPNDQEKYDEFMRVIFLCESLRNELGEKAEGLAVPATKAKLEDLERIVGHRIHFDDDMKPEVKAFVVMDEYLKKMTAKVDASDYTSYKMANVALYIRFRRISSSGRTFEKCFDMDYEGLTVSVPCGYDGLLRRSYDDFMFPAYVFFNHRYPSYDILADELKKEFDFELLKYKFSRDEYEKNIGERQEKCPLGDVVRENVALLLEAHAYVSGVVRGTEKTDDVPDISDVMSEQTISELKDLLGQCQNLAVYVGNLIEAKVKKVYQNQPDDTAENNTDTSDNAKISMKASDIIHALESYCESVFALYEGLDKSASDSADDIKLLTDGLLSHDTILEKLTEYSYEEYREIVFLVDRADNWKSLQTIWEAAKADEDLLVTVVPVPFKYKDALGMIP
nr:LicD family protein [Eubacterium sp.]